MVMPPGRRQPRPSAERAGTFVAALTDLVQAQADPLDRGTFVVLPTWTEILERHFPPEHQ
ncbi:hypothetical protein GXW83_15590 [Streptacidiphilus sp. PB12-B1b]|uniref:hypothetical protein n=1 Tax=Streptacidiphilus sp. PB12-B1b TaxID=2705012 RepID=UPI0015FBB46C|nr:hypothetical protein [Streptacidiphilus sp. PB12-B1b]QMU76930.1 hypothetical protein GXW83_15590 [Streptacidiphilus sp. PB12-B1b]